VSISNGRTDATPEGERCEGRLIDDLTPACDATPQDRRTETEAGRGWWVGRSVDGWLLAAATTAEASLRSLAAERLSIFYGARCRSGEARSHAIAAVMCAANESLSVLALFVCST